MFKPKLAFLAFLATAAAHPAAYAQLELGGNLLDNCADIDALQNSGNFSEARDKARLCLEGLEQELVGEVGQFFRPQVGDWTRTSFDQNQAMGFSNVSAEYQKGNVSVNVTLIGTSGGGSAGGIGNLGGLFGGIAQSALLQSGQKVTVAGLASTVQPDGALTVPLQDGSLLTFDSPDLNSADAALAGMGDLVNDFPVAEINAALQ
jgi:hypothetical protein